MNSKTANHHVCLKNLHKNRPHFKSRELDETESQILFELNGISHLIQEISSKLTRIAYITNPTDGAITKKLTNASTSFNTWRELFSQHVSQPDQLGDNGSPDLNDDEPSTMVDDTSILDEPSTIVEDG